MQEQIISTYLNIYKYQVENKNYLEDKIREDIHDIYNNFKPMMLKYMFDHGEQNLTSSEIELISSLLNDYYYELIRSIENNIYTGYRSIDNYDILETIYFLRKKQWDGCYEVENITCGLRDIIESLDNIDNESIDNIIIFYDNMINMYHINGCFLNDYFNIDINFDTLEELREEKIKEYLEEKESLLQV